MPVRSSLPISLIAACLAACSGPMPDPAPAKTATTAASSAPPALSGQGPTASPAPWSTPARCAAPPPVSGTLDVAFAALPPRPTFPPDRPPPVSKRGTKRKTRDVGTVTIDFVGRPHHGMYWGVGGVDPEEDAECFVAPALERLPPREREEAAKFLGRIRDPKAAVPDPGFLRSPGEGVDRDAALFLAAFFAKRPFADVEPGGAGATPGAFSRQVVLRDLMSRRGLPDPIGVRAALELADDLVVDGRAAVLGPLMKLPLSWASTTSLRRLAVFHWDGYGLEGGIATAERLYMLVGKYGASPAERAEGLVRAARVALELSGWSHVFGHASALASDPALVAALDERGADDLATAVSYVMPGLSDAEFQSLLTWPTSLLVRLAELRPTPIRSRDAALYKQVGKVFDFPAPESPAALFEDLARTCLVREDLTSGQSSVTVSVFSSGPPQVTATGKDAFSSCLTALGPAYFERAPEGARAKVSARSQGLN